MQGGWSQNILRTQARHPRGGGWDRPPHPPLFSSVLHSTGKSRVGAPMGSQKDQTPNSRLCELNADTAREGNTVGGQDAGLRTVSCELAAPGLRGGGGEWGEGGQEGAVRTVVGEGEVRTEQQLPSAGLGAGEWSPPLSTGEASVRVNRSGWTGSAAGDQWVRLVRRGLN